MKALVIICLAGGFACGWFLKKPEAASIAEAEEESVRASRQEAHAGMADVRPRLVDGMVAVAPRFFDTLPDTGSTSLNVSHYDGDEKGLAPQMENLAAAIGLDSDQVGKLHGILRAAARGRFEWETRHVKVDFTGQGRWEFSFPGDGGAAKEALLKALKAEFSPDVADAIRLAANLDAFFHVGVPGSTAPHGVVVVEAYCHDSRLSDGVGMRISRDGGTPRNCWVSASEFGGSIAARWIRLAGGEDTFLQGVAEVRRPE